MGIIYGALSGTLLDLLIEERVGVNLVGLMLIGLIATIFSKNFSKDSRITIMLMTFGSTIIFEVITYFLNYVLFSINVEVFRFISILLVEAIYNVILIIILYPLIQKFGYYIENEYKGNRILTRYF